jgi:hypothetical protein
VRFEQCFSGKFALTEELQGLLTLIGWKIKGLLGANQKTIGLQPGTCRII